MGPSPCGPLAVMAIGAPTSATTCWRKAGAAARRPSRNWVRHFCRKALLVDQSV